MPHAAGDHFDGRLAHDLPVGPPLDDHAPRLEGEITPLAFDLVAQQQFEGRLRRLVGVTGGFPLLDQVHDPPEGLALAG